MAVKIQIRRDTTSNWAANNPVLSVGEIGWDTNLKKGKVGDGSTAWSSLGFSIFTQDELNLKAPLNSPTFSGTPTAPTAAAGTNSTQISTTAYTDAAVSEAKSKLHSMFIIGGV